MTPTLSYVENVNSPANASTAIVSASFAVVNGDVIVVKAQAEDNGDTPATPTASGQTFTSRASDSTGSKTAGAIFTCTVTGSPGTIAVSQSWAGTGWRSMVVERWTNAVLAATPATNATKLASGAGGFSGSVTTTAANSIVTWLAGDWAALAPGTIGYRSSATQDGLHDKSTAIYVAYYAYQTAGAAGAQTFGLTTPAGTANWKYFAIEVKDAGGAPAIPPILIMQSRGAT